ncbi:MAG: S8 family serine peptidase [Burkholderiaceae bacterium]
MTVSTTGTGAPDGVRSTAAQFDLGVRVPTYTALQGTSMAAPHVAGVIAMMRWINPALTPGQIDVLLANGALTDDLGTPGRDNIHGWGLVNARKAVDAALASLTEPPSPLGRIEALPSALSLGATRAEAELELQRVGNTDETVTSIAWNSPAIEVIADQVDSATGLGRYRIRARREAIAEGTTVFPTIDIGTSSGRGFVVQVTVERRVASIGLGEVGAVYVIAVDANDPARATIAATLADPPVDGHYGYRLSVPAGRQVRVYAGTDLDNDTQICVAGEVCGAYPSMGDTIEAIDTSGDVHAIDFLLAPWAGERRRRHRSLSAMRAEIARRHHPNVVSPRPRSMRIDPSSVIGPDARNTRALSTQPASGVGGAISTWMQPSPAAGKCALTSTWTR